jgi:hypothetical protein
MAFLEASGGVYVHGHGDAFLVRGAAAYRYLSALLPHLDGSATVSELVAGLTEAHAASVRSLIGTLASRGVIVDSPGPGAVADPEVRARFAGQIGLLEQHGDDGAGFLRVAQARVLVVCEDTAPATALANALTANGVGGIHPGRVWVETGSDLPAAAVTGTDLVCLIAAHRPSPALFSLAGAARAAGAAFVSLVRVGEQLVLGPWQHGDGNTACLHSAMLRLSDNGMPGAAGIWQAAAAGIAAAARPAALSDAAVSIAVSVAGFEIFKALSGVIASDVDAAIVIMNPERLTIRQERVVQHPASPRGSAVKGTAAEPEDAAGSSLEHAYQRFEQVIAEAAGIIRSFEDHTITQIPVKVSALIAPAAAPAPIVAFGSGILLEARLAALEEASLRYAVNISRRCEQLLIPARPDAEVVEAGRTVTWLGATPPDDDPLVAATGIAGPAPLAFPRGAVLAGPWDRQAARFEPDLLGLAAASTPREAMSRALLGAAGAYTVAAVARGEVPVSTVEDPLIADGADPQQHRRLSMLAEAVRHDGRSLTFYLARGVVPVAIVRVQHGSGEEITVRAGHSWLDAAESALCTIAGMRQIAASPTGWTSPCLPAAPALGWFSVSERTSDASVLNKIVGHESLVTRLGAAGLRGGVVDLTPPDLAGVTNIVRVLLFRDAAADRPRPLSRLPANDLNPTGAR